MQNLFLRAVGMLVALAAAAAAPAAAQTFADPGFVSETVVTLSPYGVNGMVFAPDGRMFVWEKAGIVTIFQNGVLLDEPFLDIRDHVNRYWDRGMLGLALDPDFSANGYVYLVYTYEHAGQPESSAPRTSRVTRVQADPANPNRALAGSETTLLGTLGTPPCSQYPAGSDCITADEVSHTIDWIRFGADGKLYISNGDGAPFSSASVGSLRAQDLTSYSGKLLRVNKDGAAPGDNPFDTGSDSVRSKVYAYGLRNPYRFTFHPVTGEPFIGDVGWNRYEEIDRGAGRNFGWPCFEGPSREPAFDAAYSQCSTLPAAAVTPPMYSYDRSVGTTVVMGPFYTGTQFPAQYQGSLFFADYAADFIRRATFDGAGDFTGIVDFATNAGNTVHLELGPDGSLYYIAYPAGEIRRIRFATGNRPPIAVATATPSSGYSPLAVSFDASSSRDPDGDALTYAWDFGDGNTGSGVAPAHTYSSATVQVFTATLTVSDPSGATTTATVRVTAGSLPPTASVASPADGTAVRPGQTVNFTGSATDPDETLSAAALSWQLRLLHNTHVHTLSAASGASGSFVVEEHDPAATFAYELILTATDSSGLLDTGSVNLPALQPDFTIAANPTTRTVTRGQSAQYALGLAAVGGGGATFNAAIALACSGLPANTSCSFSPSAVTPGAATGSSALTITTRAPSAALQGAPLSGTLPLYAVLLAAPLIAAAVFGGQRSARARVLGIIAIAALSSAALACGGGGGAAGGGGPPPNPGTALGTYNLTVTGTSGSTSHATVVTLVVQ